MGKAKKLDSLIKEECHIDHFQSIGTEYQFQGNELEESYDGWEFYKKKNVSKSII